MEKTLKCKGKFIEKESTRIKVQVNLLKSLTMNLNVLVI